MKIKLSSQFSDVGYWSQNIYLISLRFKLTNLWFHYKPPVWETLR